ncbi:ABC transporter ATP-binding protein [Brucella sp. BE17]|uniref:ABC transporter ATP-binding protein n=1 Tax=Brucella sp. BE17 TaxID=3142977 RepID=UPI0031B9C75B
MNAHDRYEEPRLRIANSTTALALSGVSRCFGDVVALNDVSLEVQSGEIICLVGHSGCGKTSMLRIIAGIDVPDHGTLTMNGRDLVSHSQFIEPEKRNIGVVFQDYALFPHLTVSENVRFGLRRLGRDAAGERVRELLDLVGLASMADRYPHMLSGGEQQRVALIRALAPKPDLLLMDEPFSNLDRGLRAKIRRETVALLRSLNTTAIIVTHEAEEALSTGDRVVLMRGGEIVQSGTARDLHDRPQSRYAADFFCDFNVIQGELHGRTIKTPIGLFPAPETLQPDASMSLYLRPGDLKIVSQDEVVEDDLHCFIEARTFLGETEELLVRNEDGATSLRLRTAAHIPATASHVFVRPDHEKVLIFQS